MSSPCAFQKPDRQHFYFQVLGAIVFMTLVLFIMSLVDSSQALWAVGAGSIASSTFIIFTTPCSPSAKIYRLIGGYSVAIVVGLMVHLILYSIFLFLSSKFQIYDTRIFWMTASISVGLAMVLMTLLGCQHPPAAGVSLVLVLEIQGYSMIFVIFAAVLVLAAIKYRLNGRLVNLVGS